MPEAFRFEPISEAGDDPESRSRGTVVGEAGAFTAGSHTLVPSSP
jgi:hypothetical protein